MSLKNVVKVMNFHALLRVDKSRREAAKFGQMEQMVINMLDQIMNNRNIALDMSVLKFPKDAPALHIYLGGDMGFCGNLNNLVKGSCNEYEKKGENVQRIIVGKKIRLYDDPSVILEMSREDYMEDHQKIIDILATGITEKKYSEIRLIYNHYRNASEIDFVDKAILPLPKGIIGETAYQDDFVWEGEPQEMLKQLAANPNVNYEIHYRYQGKRYVVVIPAGTDYSQLKDSNGYYGFRYLDSIFGGYEEGTK